MNLNEYSNRIIESTKNDWNVITCWGFGAGPSYLEQSTVWSSSNNEFENIEIESHGMVASLKSDLSISMAWGMTLNSSFTEEWANQFPDPHASSGIVDFFYNGVLIFRDTYVTVDGGRCKLPISHREFDDETHEVIRHIIPRARYNFYRMLNGFVSTYDYDNYFSRTGFEVVETPWMEGL